MQFGEWKLRDDASYYLSKDSMIWPSSNAVDEGKLTTEENMRNIYRYLGIRNFVTKYNYFSLTLNPNRDGVMVSPGEGVIQGYHFYSKSAINVKVPDNTQFDDNGNPKESNYQRIDEYTLGIALAYDAANHVTGDVVNKAEEIGSSETLSGVYLKWFDKCQLECNYDNILVLGRAWVKQGLIVPDGTVIQGDRIIYHGFEPDPFKDHIYNGSNVEIEVHGHKTTQYDTLRDNMTQIHEPLYSYDSSHFPVELVREKRTKPPTFNTDIQDYINHLPDWYTSKYGDYMTGALRFNNLSIDAKREFLNKESTKDSIDDDYYSDSVFISPRTHGDLVRTSSQSVNSVDYDYNNGGTIMSIVPNTYKNSTDFNNGYTGIYSLLVSQLYGETGLLLHYGKGIESNNYNSTRLVHYNSDDSGTLKNPKNTKKENTSNFIIENTDDTGRKVSIDFRHGELFVDSFVSPKENPTSKMQVLTNTKGESYSSGIQIFVNGESHKDYANRIDFRFDETKLSMAKHDYINHRNGNRGIQHLGLNNDDLHFEIGLGINYNGIQTNVNSDAFLHMDNLLFRSNKIDGSVVKQNTISVFNTNNEELPYLRILPRVYSNQYLAEDLIQVGTTKLDDYFNHDAEQNTLNRIIMKRVNKNSLDNNQKAFTYLEQDYRYASGKSITINKWLPPLGEKDIVNGVAPEYNEISGMYSAGNIGCSTNKDMHTSRLDANDNTKDTVPYNPYQDNDEWVRFTRFRYDNDKDLVNGGTYEGKHEEGNGRKWGETYNIEFNTNVANRRANQLIWRFNGSKGKQDKQTIDNTPPVILSYIHDNTTIRNQGVATRYSNINGDNDPGTFETWIDHAGITQYNPTYKIRDFLLLENAGLVVSGDINNPSISGDSLNTISHLGVTISGGRVYNSTYNDFAETFEKNDESEIASPGMLIALNPDTGKYEICNGYENNCVVGVQSNSYAYLAGGNRINNTQDIIDLENEYFTVAVSGKVWVNVVTEDEDCLNCHIKPGDLLTSSAIKGKACQSKYLVQGTIIGKALSKPKYFEEDNQYKVLMLVITA